MVDRKKESENKLDKLKERVEVGYDKYRNRNVEIVNEYDQCGKFMDIISSRSRKSQNVKYIFFITKCC